MPANETKTNNALLGDSAEFDYTYVETTARIAIYDDLLAAPRIVEIEPNTTAEFIENLASNIFTLAKQQGGNIPYTAIREVTENFIHAQFSEIVVSILDEGKTIRFADQGPGIPNKEKAQLPGFSSAVEPMKKYIRGVGSGLPIVKEYLNFSQGSITIEDNLHAGAVVTLSTADKQPVDAPTKSDEISDDFEETASVKLTEKEKVFLSYLLQKGTLGVTDLVNLTGSAQSSTYVTLKKLEDKKLVRQTGDKKRSLTKKGSQVAKTL